MTRYMELGKIRVVGATSIIWERIDKGDRDEGQ